MKDLESVQLKPVKTVFAVSGGVDSMVLLDIARRSLPAELIVVVHVDHGIRPESETKIDRQIIEEYASKHNLPLHIKSAKLGTRASEQTAREFRYACLGEVMNGERAFLIATAHHHDDLIETAIINLLRGTGARGLAGIRERENIVRPLLEWTKSDVLEYAKAHSLKWHEDSTNADQTYLRNYVRTTIMPKLAAGGQLQEFEDVIRKTRTRQNELDSLMQEIEDTILQQESEQTWQLDRKMFVQLDHKISREVVRRIFDLPGVGKAPERQQIDKLTTFLKTGRAGRSADISKQTQLCLEKDRIRILIKSS